MSLLKGSVRPLGCLRFLAVTYVQFKHYVTFFLLNLNLCPPDPSAKRVTQKTNQMKGVHVASVCIQHGLMRFKMPLQCVSLKVTFVGRMLLQTQCVPCSSQIHVSPKRFSKPCQSQRHPLIYSIWYFQREQPSHRSCTVTAFCNVLRTQGHWKSSPSPSQGKWYST